MVGSVVLSKPWLFHAISLRFSLLWVPFLGFRFEVKQKFNWIGADKWSSGRIFDTWYGGEREGERERGSKTTWSKVIAEADLVLLVLQAMERERWPVNVWYWLNNNTVHLLTVYCYWYWSDRSSLNRAVGCQWIRHSAGSSLFCFWKSTIRWCGIHTHLFSSRVTIYIIIIWQCYHSILWVLS